MTGIVAVVSGNYAGSIGLVCGPDRLSRCGARFLVRFPGVPFPRDFRSIHAENLRPATPAEIFTAIDKAIQEGADA